VSKHSIVARGIIEVCEYDFTASAVIQSQRTRSNLIHLLRGEFDRLIRKYRRRQ
jgi:hypothetical protein